MDFGSRWHGGGNDQTWEQWLGAGLSNWELIYVEEDGYHFTFRGVALPCDTA